MDILDDKSSLAYYFSKHRLIRELIRAKTGVLNTEENVLRCIILTSKITRCPTRMVCRELVRRFSLGVFLVEDEKRMGVYHDLSKEFLTLLKEENDLELKYELGRGGESIVFCAEDSVGKEYAVSFSKDPRRQSSIFDFEVPKGILLDVYMDDVLDIPLYKRYNKPSRIIIMQKADMSLSDKLDHMSSEPIKQRFAFATKVIKQSYDLVKRLADAGYEHDDRNAGNIAYFEGTEPGTFELRFMDISSVIKRKWEAHPGWIASIYYQVLEVLDLADLYYTDGELYPEVVKWRYKKLSMV